MRIEGDFKVAMREFDVPWVLRKGAVAMGYGVQRTVVKIKQFANAMEVTNINTLNAFTRSFTLDGKENDEVVSGRRLKTISYWMGGTLITETQDTKSRKYLPKVLRYMHDDDMVVEMVLSSGQVVKQFFEWRAVNDSR
jgi:hypothetical protein